MSSLFQDLSTEYTNHLESFTQALINTVEMYTSDVISLNEAQRKVETHLSRSIEEWVTDFGESYALRLKQMARQQLEAQAGEQRNDLFELENGLDEAVEQHLRQLSQPDHKTSPLEIPSPYLKPGATLGTAALVSFLMLTKGGILFLVAGLLVGGGGVVTAWKVFQSELLHTRRELKDQAQSAITEFKRGVASYFQTAAQAIEQTTDQYIQEHIGNTSQEQS